MSRELKYIGMDVHKEAVVIAVLNSRCRDCRIRTTSDYPLQLCAC